MNDTDVAEILKLPVEERLRLVELIWETSTDWRRIMTVESSKW